MKIRSSRVGYAGLRLGRTTKLQPDPEEQRMAESRANIERLRAARDEAARRVAYLKWQSEAASRARVAQLKAEKAEFERTIARLDPDWLCYLPSAAGNPELIARACKYLQEMQTRVEAQGGRMWLCADHNCQNSVCFLNDFRVFDGAVFCSVEWTELGRAKRHTYRGISADRIVFAGDPDLILSMTPPPVKTMQMSEMPEEVQAAALSDRALGLCGACCLSFPPAYGVTGIYRLAKGTMKPYKTN